MMISTGPEVLWLLAIAMLIVFLFLAFPFIRVSGVSMLPTLEEGDILLSTRLYSDLKVGDVVVVRLLDKVVIKRIKIKKGQMLFLEGDNKNQSCDSRHYGYINEKRVVSKVLSRKVKKNE